MNKARQILIISLVATLLCSCDGFNKIAKSTDRDAQYEAAVRYYEEGSYGKARTLLETLQTHCRDRAKLENVSWMLAMSQFKERDYLMAAYGFTTFLRRYPYSEHAEEALFNSAYCKYREAPPYSLDQALTRDAIADLERFVETYPQSIHVPEVNQYLDDLRERLMLKDYEIAYGYYRIEQYHAAYVSLKNFINLYPDSPKREEAMYYIIKSGYIYGANSREDKMRERLEAVINDFNKFSTLFENSKYLQECQDIYTKTQALLAKLEK